MSVGAEGFNRYKSILRFGNLQDCKKKCFKKNVFCDFFTNCKVTFKDGTFTKKTHAVISVRFIKFVLVEPETPASFRRRIKKIIIIKRQFNCISFQNESDSLVMTRYKTNP